MQQVEPLHLKHVLQAVCVLEGVVLRSFGPRGGQVLFTRDTGQLMLSRSGKRILTALHLDHPLARMAVESAWKHSEVTGDGAKTFILLLASLLRGIQTAACKGSIASRAYVTRAATLGATARRTAEELLAFGLEELGDVIGAGVVPHAVGLSWESGALPHCDTDTDVCAVQRLLATFFYTRLGPTHSQLIARLTRDLISLWRLPTDPPSLALRFLENNFAALHTLVCGFTPACSRLMEGQVIHRDFATTPRPPQPEPQQQQQQPIKAVALMLGCSLHPSVLSSGAVLKVGSLGGVRGAGVDNEEGGIVKYSAWAERSLEGTIGTLQGLGVTLLLSAGKQSEAALAAARRAGISVVECVDEEELSLFAQLSGARPVAECLRIGREHVARLTFCKPVVLGAHRYVHIAFSTPEVRPLSLVVCGTGEGQVEQFALAVRDALRMLLATQEPWRRTAEDDDDDSSRASLRSHPHKPRGANAETCADHPADGAAAASWRGALDSRCVLPAGGAFEFLLHRALLRRGRVSQLTGGGGNVPALCRLLADALLCVPRHIYSHRPRHFLQAQRLSFTSCSGTSLCSGRQRGEDDDDGDGDIGGGGGERIVSLAAGERSHSGSSGASDTGLESVFCKYQLILAVLQCLCCVLRVDAVLRVHKVPRIANSFPEDTGDDDDDEDDDEDDDG